MASAKERCETEFQREVADAVTAAWRQSQSREGRPRSLLITGPVVSGKVFVCRSVLAEHGATLDVSGSLGGNTAALCRAITSGNRAVGIRYAHYLDDDGVDAVCQLLRGHQARLSGLVLDPSQLKLLVIFALDASSGPDMAGVERLASNCDDRAAIRNPTAEELVDAFMWQMRQWMTAYRVSEQTVQAVVSSTDLRRELVTEWQFKGWRAIEWAAEQALGRARDLLP